MMRQEANGSRNALALELKGFSPCRDQLCSSADCDDNLDASGDVILTDASIILNKARTDDAQILTNRSYCNLQMLR